MDEHYIEGFIKKSDERPAFPINLRASGMLWYINKVAFHPQGFALAVTFGDDGSIDGFAILGDGSEPWQFEKADEDRAFIAVKQTLAGARVHNAKG